MTKNDFLVILSEAKDPSSLCIGHPLTGIMAGITGSGKDSTMSLTSEQKAATIREFRENMRRLGLTVDQIGEHFGVSGNAVERIIDLKSGVLEYPWIVRGYLIDLARERNIELTPFTALKGDPHSYWFLSDAVLDAGTID